MEPLTTQQRCNLASQTRAQLQEMQLARLNELLAQILPHHPFYGEKLDGLELPLADLSAVSQLPLTAKDELLPDSPTRPTRQLTWPVERYVRFHQTSGTRGRPLMVLDTAADWAWWIDTWQYVLDAAELTAADRVMMAFSFGPFIGFWSAFEAVTARGCLALPGGGMSSLARLEMIRTAQATALFCTPSYALHLLDVAHQHGIHAGKLPIRAIIVAGEPGGSIPAIREKMEQGWQAQVIDHSGATEVGPWGYQDPTGRGIRIIETEFLPEFVPLGRETPGEEEPVMELVLTNLGRVGCPVIRYRTGDLVRPKWDDGEQTGFVLLEGGVLGRTDDMMIIRGVNIFPSSVEQILRSFPEIVEYRLTAFKRGEMDQLQVEVEDRLGQPQRVAAELRVLLGLNVEVQSVELGSLPRFEGKGKRFVDRRRQGGPPPPSS